MSTYTSTQGGTETGYVTLITRCCSECAITYAIPLRKYEIGQEHGTGWYCPNGHNQSPVAKSTEQKLKEERARSGRLASERDQIEASRRAQKGATTRARRRHAAGVCPACQRTFQNVQRHMESQHPDFDPAESRHEGS